MRYPAQAWSPFHVTVRSESEVHIYFFFLPWQKESQSSPCSSRSCTDSLPFPWLCLLAENTRELLKKSHRWQNVLCRQWLTQTGQGMLLVIKLSSPFAAALNTYYGCQAVSKLSDDPTSSGCKVTWQLQGCLVHRLVGLGKLVPAAEPQEYVSTKGWLFWKIPHAWKSVSVSRMCRWRNRVN